MGKDDGRQNNPDLHRGEKDREGNKESEALKGASLGSQKIPMSHSFSTENSTPSLDF